MHSIEPRRPEPRLAPIDRPVGLIQRLMVWYFRLRFGRVMSALRRLKTYSMTSRCCS